MTHDPWSPEGLLDRRRLLRGAGALSAAALVSRGATAGAPPRTPAPLAATLAAAAAAPTSGTPLLLPGFAPADDDDAVTPAPPGDPLRINPFAAPRLSCLTSPADLAAARSLLLQSAFCRRNSTNVEGPYYVPNPLVRRNIIEDRIGVPVTLFFAVVREADCSPVVGATVDVWHADQNGVYSGFAQQGTAGRVFLRGVQTTDANGLVQFETIYPGWYPGRTPHLHVKVRPTPTTVITLQTFFDGLFGFPGLNLSDVIYRFVTPYSARGPANTYNNRDGLFTPDTVMAAILNPNGTPSLWAGMVLAIA